MEKVKFNYSEWNLIAYLLYLGYEPVGSNVVEKRGNPPKVFIQFEGSTDELLDIQNRYVKNEIPINLVTYGKCKDKAVALIKSKLKAYINSK